MKENGGPTRTMALRSNSPAIDPEADSDLVAIFSLGMDQRGAVRPSGACPDVGAFESGAKEGFAGWAATRYPEVPQFVYGEDSDGNGLGNGAEFAMGHDPRRGFHGGIEYPMDGVALKDGRHQLTIPIHASAVPMTIWTLHRLDAEMTPVEIARYHGPSETITTSPDVRAIRASRFLQVIDETPLEAPVLFYRWVTALAND